LFSVDRFEGSTAVVVADDGATYEVARSRLPRASREGSVLSVPLGEGARPQWERARLDAAETERRRSEGRELLRDLRRRDPGGDLAL
jgi:hypothetical protein